MPQGSLVAVREVPRRGWRLSTAALGLLLVLIVLPLLILADSWCLVAARVPVHLAISPAQVRVTADGQTLATTLDAAPDAIVFVPASKATREYQVDGTDNTNNFTEDAADLATLLPTPAYQFEAWMRGNDSYSTWVDLQMWTPEPRTAHPSLTHPVALPPGQEVTITVALERPEAPAVLVLRRGDQVLATITFDRNSRLLRLAGTATAPVSAYFPEQPLPFAAEVMDTLLRVAIWAWVMLVLVLGLALLGDGMGRLARAAGVMTRGDALAVRAARWRGGWRGGWRASAPRAFAAGPLSAWVRRATHWAHFQVRRLARRTTWPDRVAAVVLAAAFGFIVYIALAQYHAAPHILDASAYYFQAKIFASGRLSAPVPADLAAFQGPFMVAWQGHWFAQYPPATSALLAVGLLAGVPWLVEPLLGTVALAGVYLIGCRLFGGPTALLAVALGAISPFFTYLAAAYLSHTIALCFEVYFLLFALRFMERYRQRDIVVAGACLGAMFCTRELSAVICGLVTTAWLAGWQGRCLWRDRRVVVPATLAGLTALGVGMAFYLAYNFAQTGNALILPRTLFSSADQYGFGMGIGFYGQHTVAAGLVILDQLLTSLLIDLYGWPFYLTLALIPISLLRRDRARRWDWFLLTLAGAFILAQAGYFYHGIYLGPRYLYETLPCLLLLTARGITALPDLAQRTLSVILAWWPARRGQVLAGADAAARPAISDATRSSHAAARAASGIIVAALVAFNLGFYLPRQLAQHQDFTGLPPSVLVDTAAIYRNPPRHALVITSNWQIYNYVLWPLNDPLLLGSTLYAVAPGPGDIARLIGEFPNRTVYILIVGPHGQVSYLPLTP
jgi:hypothetical protein